jgi:hypothetical protein
MTPELIAFLTDLADVIERHKGGLIYTNDDDGIHAFIGAWARSEPAAIGLPENGDTSEIRRIIERASKEQ